MATLSLPKKTTPKVVQASVEDAVRIAVFGEQFWRQTDDFQAGIEYDSDSVLETINAIVEDGVALYAEHDGTLVGLMLVIVAPHLMNKNHLLAYEWVFYVAPKFRRGGLGTDLIVTAEQVLKKKRVSYFTMVSLQNVTPKEADKLYERLGFVLSEKSFKKEILPWQSQQSRPPLASPGA